MDFGIRKFFSRGRSRNKLSANGDLAHNTTPKATPNGLHVEPPTRTTPTAKNDSQEKVKQRSYTQLRPKDTALQEFIPSSHAETIHRPSTAPGKSSTRRSLSLRSKFNHRPRHSQEEKQPPSHAAEPAPNIPELPKGLADLGDSKYQNFIHAVATPNSENPPETTRQPRNDADDSAVKQTSSTSGDPFSNRQDTRSSLDHGGTPGSLRQAADSQRASFDAMRACRNAQVSPDRVTVGKEQEARSESSAAGKDQISSPLLKTGTQLDNETRFKLRSASPVSTPKRVPSPALQPVSEVRTSNGASSPARAQITSATYSGQRQLHKSNGSISKSGSSSSVALQSPITKDQSKVDASRDHNTPSASSSPNPRSEPSVTPYSIANSPTSQIQDRPTSHEKNVQPIPSTQRISDSAVAPEKDVQTRSGSIDNERQASRQEPRHSRRLQNGSDLDRLWLTSPSSRRQSRELPSPVGQDNTTRADDSGDDGDDSGDDEMVDAVTHQNEPDQVLAGSVTSGNTYKFRAGQNTVIGKVLRHRPSLALSPVSKEGISVEPQGLSAHTTNATEANGFSSMPALEASRTNAGTLTSRPTAVPADVDLQPPPKVEKRAEMAAPVGSASHSLTAKNTLPIPATEAATAKTVLPKSNEAVQQTPSTPPQSHLPQVQSTPSGLQSPSTSGSAAKPASEFGLKSDASNLGTGQDRVVSLPPVLTRDFAQSSAKPSIASKQAGKRIKSETISRKNLSVPKSVRIRAPSGYRNISPPDVEEDDAEIDRRIALKKEAAAQALLRLKEVMAMPSWEQPATQEHIASTSRRGPGHWRDLSIEDGSPIAPSAIFNKVKMPPLSESANPTPNQPSPSKEVTRASRRSSDMTIRATQREMSPVTNRISSVNSPVARRYTPQPRNSSLPVAAEQKTRASGASESREEIHKATTGPVAVSSTSPSTGSPSRSHGRKNSTMSAESGTSAHSIQPHMVPARGSSTRDSDRHASHTT